MENGVLQQILDELIELKQGVGRLDRNQAIMEKAVNDIKNSISNDRVSQIALKNSFAVLEAGQIRLETRMDNMSDEINVIKEDIEEIKEGLEEVRTGTNTLLDGAERTQPVLKVPL